MRFWKQKPVMTEKSAAVQLRTGAKNPFEILNGYVPLRNSEMQLYRAVREAVPVVDAAIYKQYKSFCTREQLLVFLYRLQQLTSKKA